MCLRDSTEDATGRGLITLDIEHYDKEKYRL